MVTTSVETITPEVAREYMKHNTDNIRKLNRNVMKDYATDILRGKWQLNGETIVFSESGVLKNGQHRLGGVILANRPIECVVVRGVSDDVNVYDMNRRRTNTDVAKTRGFECDSTLMAVSNIIVNCFNGRRSGTQVIDYAEKHIDELNRAQRITGDGGKNAPSICATYLILRNKLMPSYEIELFFRLMNDFSYTFADGYEVSPALVAQRMFDERGTNKGGSKAIQRERLEILTLALKDFHTGKKRELKYKIKEPFEFMGLLNKVRKEDGMEG